MDGERKIPLRGFGCVLFLCSDVALLCFLMVIRGSTVSLFFVVIWVCMGGGGGVLSGDLGLSLGIRGEWGDSICIWRCSLR